MMKMVCGSAGHMHDDEGAVGYSSRPGEKARGGYPLGSFIRDMAWVFYRGTGIALFDGLEDEEAAAEYRPHNEAGAKGNDSEDLIEEEFPKPMRTSK